MIEELKVILPDWGKRIIEWTNDNKETLSDYLSIWDMFVYVVFKYIFMKY